MSAVLALVRSPRIGAPLVVERGRLSVAATLVGLATVIAAANVARFAADVSVQDVMFGPQRSAAIATLLALLGRDLTAVVLHLLESAWSAVLVASALGPLWIWLLGASAIHAAARLGGAGRPFLPILVLFGHATGVTRAAADLAALVLGGRGPAAGIAQLVGLAALVWLGAMALRGIEAHYGVEQRRAITILLVAIGLFYLVPLLIIVAAVVAIVVAAVVLEYFPAR